MRNIVAYSFSQFFYSSTDRQKDRHKCCDKTYQKETHSRNGFAKRLHSAEASAPTQLHKLDHFLTKTVP